MMCRKWLDLDCINTAIENLEEKSLVSDGFNSFSDLYTIAMAFIKLTLESDSSLIPYITTYNNEKYFEFGIAKPYANKFEWTMDFPIEYIDTILKYTP